MVDAADWIAQKRGELTALLQGAGYDDERVLQDWLERHPAFVPGYAGRFGLSGHRPWPSALITQPELIGFEKKIPDFCWLTVDSARFTAVMIEIEKPSKSWFTQNGQPSAELTQARNQITEWKSWFANPSNAARFREDYLVPDYLKDLRFEQTYILVYGSRAEYATSATLTGIRAQLPGDHEEYMSFDRLPDLARSEYAGYGCVRRVGERFQAKAVPETWDPGVLSERALLDTSGYPDAIAASPVDQDRQAQLIADLAAMQPQPRTDFVYHPATPTLHPGATADKSAGTSTADDAT